MRAANTTSSGASAWIYALPSAGVGFSFFMVSILFLKYATDVLGISAAAMGWILLMSRLWDAVSDPLAGFLSDRTSTRLGRRRPWMIGAALPLGLLIVALWSPPESLSGASLTVWTAAVFLLLYTATTAFGVPYDALGAELSLDYHERNRIFGLKRVAFGAGTLAALAGIALLTSYDLSQEAGRAAARRAAGGVALVAALLTAGLTAFAAWRIRERPDYRYRGGRRPLEAVADVWRNPRARILISVFVIQQFGITCVVLMAPYFIDYVLLEPRHTATVILAFMLGATASIPFWLAASRRVEKKSLLMGAMVAISLGMLPGLWLGAHDVIPAVLFAAAAGVASGGTDTLFPSMQADVIDVDEHRTGERKEGTYFALWSFASKSAASGVGMVVGFALDFAGYVPNAHQTPETLRMIRFLYAGLPLIFWSAGIWVFRRFHLSEADHALIRAEIDARRGTST